jgi:hypothetical protein
MIAVEKYKQQLESSSGMYMYWCIYM